MEISNLIPHIESLIFASDKPLTSAEITELINQAFGFMEEFKRDDFLIVPVSLNYSHPAQFGGDIFCNVGNAIAVKDYLALYRENPAKAVNELTRMLESKMKELTPHLDHKENDEVIEQLQDICKHQFLTENKLDHTDLGDHQKYWYYITRQLNSVTNESPEKAEQLRKTTMVYTEKLKKLGIRDVNVYNRSKGIGASAGMWFTLILGFPIYLIGKIINFVPWISSHAIARKTAKDIEFFTSVNYVTNAFISILYLAVELIALWCIFGVWWYLPAYFLAKILIGFMALRYSRFKKTAIGCIRVGSLEKNNSTLFNELVSLRKEILSNLTVNSALLIRQ